jgi:hypothetical protein
VLIIVLNIIIILREELVPVIEVDLGLDDTISLPRALSWSWRLLPEQRPVALLNTCFQNKKINIQIELNLQGRFGTFKSA